MLKADRLYAKTVYLIVSGKVPCPLFQNEKIVQQPADLLTLTENYVKAAESFIKTVAGILHIQPSVSQYRPQW